MSLPAWSVRQVVFVNILFLICLLAGLAALQRTPVDFFPDISFNETNIDTIWTGASAQEIEQLVTTKIEEEIDAITGIKEIRSYSQADLSTILITWDETLTDAEYESAVNDLRAAVDRVTDLPEDAEEPIIRELSIAEVRPAIQVAVVDVDGVGDTALLEIARDAKRRLETLPGIEKCVIRADHDRELRVLVDRDAAARYGVTVVEIADRIRRQNVNVPAGTFTSAAGEATLRATGDYRSTEEILSTVIRENGDGTYLRLRDVARLEAGLEKRRFYSRYNGHSSLMVGIVKEEQGDVREVSAVAVHAWIERYAAVLPDGVELHSSWDSSTWVSSRMGVIWDNLVTGVLLVMAVLWFTIGFRNAALTIIAIPFSFLTALIFFPMLDMTINSLSLIGLLLVSGMLVDDAIIVLENIYRRIELGQPVQQAVVEGAEEVMWPVIAAVTTTCAAFLPLLLVTGTSGEFMELVPKAVIACLLASLFECLVVLPAHYMDFGSRRRQAAERAPAAAVSALSRLLRPVTLTADRVRASIDGGIDALRQVYLRALDVVLAHRGPFAALGVASFFFAIAGMTHLPVDLFPSEFNNFFVSYEAPTEYGLAQTNERMLEFERAAVQPMLGDDLVDYQAVVGNTLIAGQDFRIGANLGVIYAWIADTPEYRLAPELAVKRLQERLDAHRAERPDGVAELRAMLPRNGPPIGKPVAVRVEGDDWAVGKSISREMQEYLHTLPGVSNVEDNLKEGPIEVRLVVDDARAGRHGLSFEELARALRAANDGIVASAYRGPDQGEEIDIRVLPEREFRGEVADLLETEVLARGGELVKLGDVADVEIVRGYVSLAHYEGKRTVTVYADVDGETATSLGVNRALATHFADLSERFPDINIAYGGEFQETEATFRDMQTVFPIALLAIYMILAALFRSYLQPLVVVTAIPLGIIGVVAGMALLGYTISLYLMYATIGLMGVVVNDSLVMVDFINRARAEGLPLLEAVRRSGATRLRPILLTTVTTVAALLPMALGIQGESKTYGPFAASIAFGLMFAMVGTLFYVPLAYTALTRGEERVRAWIGRLRGAPAVGDGASV